MNIKVKAEFRGMRKTEKGFLCNFEDSLGEPFKVFTKTDPCLEKGDFAELNLVCNNEIFFVSQNVS